ncbi:unnamed protein product [Pieris brassicae]|uniref:Uncharacterized protein n=1 Tax=Pieris brassicae TaxID=7116 RepID=A0A9P0TST6_PIEBR|nr:unnamed protein product [Pieris brassicae]
MVYNELHDEIKDNIQIIFRNPNYGFTYCNTPVCRFNWLLCDVVVENQVSSSFIKFYQDIQRIHLLA